MIAKARADTRAAALAVLVAGVAAACWVVTVRQMRGMDMGPGTDLGSFSFFAPAWTAMMAAMMLPSALPVVLSFDRSARDGRGGPAATIVFAASYVAVWAAVGVLAYVAYRAVHDAHPGFLAWDEAGPYVAGGAVGLAGLYELTPLKRASLERCRAAADHLAGPPVSSGLRYGAVCLGCSAGLMLVLFAVGVMSIFWMLFVGALIFLEKVLPIGGRLHVPVGLLLIGLGAWIAFAAGSVPQLTLPM
jgi:predicted metal-binding membrane protein